MEPVRFLRGGPHSTDSKLPPSCVAPLQTSSPLEMSTRGLHEPMNCRCAHGRLPQSKGSTNRQQQVCQSITVSTEGFTPEGCAHSVPDGRDYSQRHNIPPTVGHQAKRSVGILSVDRNLFRVPGFVTGDRLQLTSKEGVSPCPPL